jgi:hypothetical protein
VHNTRIISDEYIGGSQVYITSTAQGRIQGLEVIQSTSSVITNSTRELIFTSSFTSRYTRTLMLVGDRSLFSARKPKRLLLNVVNTKVYNLAILQSYCQTQCTCLQCDQ